MLYTNIFYYAVFPMPGVTDQAGVVFDCLPFKTEFPWNIVRGVDFARENGDFRIVKLEINYCPPVEDVCILYLFLFTLKVSLTN